MADERFSYELITPWQDATVARPALEGLKPHQLLLLLSDGSLTLELELLYGSIADVEVTFKGLFPLSTDAAGYLGVESGELALEREVWLKVEGRRLVYARSVIPLSRIDASLREVLEKYHDEPLGRILNTHRVFFAKEGLEVALVKSRAAACALGIPADTPLVARRYILHNGESPQKWTIKASLIEVFSPELIPAPHRRGAGH